MSSASSGRISAKKTLCARGITTSWKPTASIFRLNPSSGGTGHTPSCFVTIGYLFGITCSFHDFAIGPSPRVPPSVYHKSGSTLLDSWGFSKGHLLLGVGLLVLDLKSCGRLARNGAIKTQSPLTGCCLSSEEAAILNPIASKYKICAHFYGLKYNSDISAKRNVALGVVDPMRRDYANFEAKMPCERQRLDIKSPAINARYFKNLLGGGGRKGLEPALRIPYASYRDYLYKKIPHVAKHAL